MNNAASCAGSRRPILVATIGMLFLLPALLKDASDQTFRCVVAVDVGGVEEIDALIRTHSQSV